MLFDTPDSILKNQSLNDTQKLEIKSQLTKSKYSRLSYNKSEISQLKIDISSYRNDNSNQMSDNVLTSDEEMLHCSNTFTGIKNNNYRVSTTSPTSSLMTDDETFYDKTFEQETINEQGYDEINDENYEKEINEIISGVRNTKLPLSPSAYYLNRTKLNKEDKRIVDMKDKKLSEKFRLNKNKITKDSTKVSSSYPVLKSKLEILKEQQNLHKKSSETESKKSPEKDLENDDPKPIKSAEMLKQMLKTDESYTFENFLEVSDTERIKGLELKLSDLVKEFKMIRQRCETVEHMHLFETNFSESLRSSVLCIEKIKDESKSKMTTSQLQNRLNDLLIIENKYSQILEDMENKADMKLDQYAKKKEKIEQDALSKKLFKEKQEKEAQEQKQLKYLEELDKYETKFQEVGTFFKHLNETNLTKKILVIESLADSGLLVEANKYRDLNKTEMKKMTIYIDTNVLSSKKLLVSDFSEKDLGDFFKDLKDNLLKFIKFGEDLENQLKKFNQNIESVLNDKIKKENENKAAEKAKKIAEEIEKLAAEGKKAEEEKQKLLRKKEVDLNKAKHVDTINRVKAINEADKNGIHHLAFIEYENRKVLFNKFTSDVEEKFKESSLKLYKYDLQKAVNFPLNSMLEDKTNHENTRNFNEKVKTLLRLLNGYTCTITSTLTVNPTKHPRAIDFCLIYIARKLVEKGEETVASRPETAFQYAQLIVDIIKQVPSFEDIILGQIQEKCPLIAPYYKPRGPNQSDDEYLISLGYKTTAGKLEEEVHYHKRMSGVFHLYFTLLILINNSVKCKIGLKTAWQWLTDILNLSPRPNVTAEMLNIFFKCCSYRLSQNYGKQFFKLVDVCANDFFDLIKSIPVEKQVGASIGRLETCLKPITKGKISEWKNIN